MKKTLLTVLASLMLCGAAFAQDTTLRAKFDTINGRLDTHDLYFSIAQGAYSNLAAAWLDVQRVSKMPAYDVGSFTNGTLANARLDADLQALAGNDGSALTDIPYSAVAGINAVVQSGHGYTNMESVESFTASRVLLAWNESEFPTQTNTLETPWFDGQLYSIENVGSNAMTFVTGSGAAGNPAILSHSFVLTNNAVVTLVGSGSNRWYVTGLSKF